MDPTSMRAPAITGSSRRGTRPRTYAPRRARNLSEDQIRNHHQPVKTQNLFTLLSQTLSSADELIKNAKYIATPGKGILAADESIVTIGKRLSSINVDNNIDNRQALRELLLTSPNALTYLSGVIFFFEETLYQKTIDGKPFVELLKENNVVPGIKVDKGSVDLAGTNGENTTQGFELLGARCQQFYEAGARFAKWCAVLKIGITEPSELSIQQNAQGLAHYARICQDNGLVPIVEPEVLTDGSHDTKKCAAVTETVLADHVPLEGTLLKPNMVAPGSDSPKVIQESPL